MRPKISYATIVWVALVGCHLFVLWQVEPAFSQLETPSDITTRIRAYRTQLAANGRQVAIRLQLAKLYLQIEAYAEAVDEYQQTLTVLGVNSAPKSAADTHASDISAAYYGLGLAYTGLEKFDAAIAAYRRALAVAPDLAYTHAALGNAYANTHRYAEALEAYKIAVALDPDDKMIHHQLGNVYSKRGDHAAAIRHQRQAIALAPKFGAAHYQLGLLYAHQKRWDAAINAYRTAYQYDPTLVEALYNLAQAYRRIGDTTAAREQMKRFQDRKAVLDPLHQLRGALQRTQDTTERAQILANIGRHYLKDGNYEKAIWEYQKALGMNPQLAMAYNGIGIAYTVRGKYSEAVDAQKKALALQPDFVEAHAGLGLIYLRQKHTKTALKHYRQAVALDPQFLEAHLKIAMILLNQGSYAAAGAAYQTIIALKPDDAETYHNLGLCYAHQARATGDTRQPLDMELTHAALTALKKAVALSSQSEIQPPFLRETHYLIGELQASQDDFSAAEKAYLASKLPKAYHALAQLSAKKAGAEPGVTLETARRYAQQAIDLDPNVASHYNTLALIEFRRGDYQQAEQAIRKALTLEPNNRNYQQGLKQISGKL